MITTNYDSLTENCQFGVKGTDELTLLKSLVDSLPELSWLVGDVQASPENSDLKKEKSYGQLLFDNQSSDQIKEFDRTACALLLLHYTLADDYESFTAGQATTEKLSKESFDSLRFITKSILPNEEAVYAMIVYLVINDLTKIDEIIDLLKREYELTHNDHDVLLYKALCIDSNVSPSFASLSNEYQELMIESLKPMFNFGQFIQGECPASSLEKLKDLSERELNFYLVHVLFDIAGAAGHIKQNGSLVLIESTWNTIKDGIQAINGLKYSSFEKVYKNFIEDVSASPLKNSSFSKIYWLAENNEIDDKDEIALNRLILMLRAREDEQLIQRLYTAWKSLPSSSRAILRKELSEVGSTDNPAILLYYAPAILKNALQGSLSKAFFEPVKGTEYPELKTEKIRILTLCLNTFAMIFQETRLSLRSRNKSKSNDSVITVMCSEVAQASEKPQRLLMKRWILVPDEDTMTYTVTSKGMSVNTLPDMFTTELMDAYSLEDCVIPSDKVMIVGIGGGSDGIQAALLARLFEKQGISVPAVVSIRSNKRTVENHGGEITDGVYTMTPESKGSGRFLEHLPSAEVPMYLCLEGDLQTQLSDLIEHVGGITRILLVDTGGDVLYLGTEHDGVDAVDSSPDQDERVLKEILKISGYQVDLGILAMGVDTPPNAHAILESWNASCIGFSDVEKQFSLEKYQNWKMDGTNESYFGKTPLAFQAALRGEYGNTMLPIPEKHVISEDNPWRANVYVTHAMGMMFLIDCSDIKELLLS